jgi:phage shock protein PspC (stress-responsive transcriptional regulator)
MKTRCNPESSPVVVYCHSELARNLFDHDRGRDKLCRYRQLHPGIVRACPAGKGVIPVLKIGVYRSQDRKWITGVCAGLADYFKINPGWVRLVFALVAIVPAGIGIIPVALVYIALTILLPEKPNDPFSSTF